MKKYFFVCLGAFSVVLGIVGIFLPVMPTVPFMILAAFFFSRSSPRLHQWVLNLPKLGPVVKDWEENGRIPVKVKWLAIFAIIIFMSSSIYFVPTLMIRYSLLFIGFAISIFIISRPH